MSSANAEARPIHVLIVEDDEPARQSLVHIVERAGYAVSQAADGEQVIALLGSHGGAIPDIIITDLLLRGIDGVQVLRIARSLPSPPEVILLTGYGTLRTAIEALRFGAFDYLLKPCQPADLLQCLARAVERQEWQRALAQLRSEQRQPAADAPPSGAAGDSGQRAIRVGELSIDTRQHHVHFRGQPVHLTPTEYRLLLQLAQVPGQLLSYEELVRHVYEQEPLQNTNRLLKTHMHNLRRKLSADYIRNTRGVGYWLADPASPASADE